MDHYDRIIETEKILLDNNLIDVDDISLDISYEIYDAIQSSFDKRRYGLEFRASYFQELTKESSGLDKYGFMAFHIRWEYPLSMRQQISLQGDLSNLVSGGDNYMSYSLLAAISTVRGRYLESETGIRIDGWKNGVESRTTSAFGEIEYDITDVVSWDNRFEYRWEEDETTSHSFTSQITYNLY